MLSLKENSFTYMSELSVTLNKNKNKLQVLFTDDIENKVYTCVRTYVSYNVLCRKLIHILYTIVIHTNVKMKIEGYCTLLVRWY